MIRLAAILCFFCLLLGPSPALGQVSPKERDALIDLYENTRGEQWKIGWDLEAAVDRWHGIEVSQGHVVGIDLMMNDLKGGLPESLGDLRHLVRLNLAFNEINGE